MKKNKKKIVLHPIMTFIILIVITILLSGLLGAFGLSTNYNFVNTVRGNFESATISVKSLLNLSGLKMIFTTAVSNFVNFAPLSSLLILLIGIGIMDKSGFLQAFFSLVTKKASKFKVTFILSLICVLASIIGDISFIVLIPITALFFKYGKRNPKAGIIMSFAALTCGTGINIFINSIDSALLSYTNLAAVSFNSAATINTLAYIFIMILLTIGLSFIITITTENTIIPKLEKYEVDEEEFYLDKKKKRGLLYSLGIGVIYLFIFIYNIIPGLPFSGNLLDYSQPIYIDKLFGYNSFFNQGFVFVITMFFVLCGLFYGIGAKTIKNNRDVCDFFGHSLDDIGKTIVLIFFASTFISIFKETNIGTFVTALFAKLISISNFSGIPLILLTVVVSALVTLLVPSPVSSYSILSGVIVPLFINSGMTGEFAELAFRAGQSITFGLTPIMAYFVIYLAYLDKYSEEDHPVSLFNSLSLTFPYVIKTAILWISLLIIAYILGLPIGFGTYAIL